MARGQYGAGWQNQLRAACVSGSVSKIEQLLSVDASAAKSPTLAKIDTQFSMPALGIAIWYAKLEAGVCIREACSTRLEAKAMASRHCIGSSSFCVAYKTSGQPTSWHVVLTVMDVVVTHDTSHFIWH